jgi:hypothetical protein
MEMRIEPRRSAKEAMPADGTLCCPFAQSGEFGTSRGGRLTGKLHRMARARKGRRVRAGADARAQARPVS